MGYLSMDKLERVGPFKHFSINAKGNVVGISMLSEIVKNENTIPNAVYMPDNIGFKWRYVNGGFLPPLEPTEAETLAKELKTVEKELRRMYRKEAAEAGFAAYLGESQTEPLALAKAAPLAMSRKDELMARRLEIKRRLNEITDFGS